MLKIRSVLPEIEDLQDLLGTGNTRERRVRNIGWINQRLTPIPLNIGRRGPVHCDGAKGFFLTKEQIAEVGLTDTRGTFQHGFEYRLELAGRAADNTKDLGGRRLLL